LSSATSQLQNKEHKYL